MATKARCYKTIDNSVWHTRISQMLMSGNPVYMIKLFTTGLNPEKDRLLGISIIKTHFEDDGLVKDDLFTTLMNPYVSLTDDILTRNGLTEQDINNAPDVEQALKLAFDFMGTEANILGFNTGNFIGPFLENEAKRYNLTVPVKLVVDLVKMGQSLLEPEKSIGYGLSGLSKRFKFEKLSGPDAYVSIFNELYHRIPNGTEEAKVTNVSVKEFSYNNRYLYIDTNCGQVRFNRRNNYFEESIPGFFDIVDMDALTSYILERTKTTSMSEFQELYPSNYVK